MGAASGYEICLVFGGLFSKNVVGSTSTFRPFIAAVTDTETYQLVRLDLERQIPRDRE